VCPAHAIANACRGAVKSPCRASTGTREPCWTDAPDWNAKAFAWSATAFAGSATAFDWNATAVDWNATAVDQKSKAFDSKSDA